MAMGKLGARGGFGRSGAVLGTPPVSIPAGFAFKRDLSGAPVLDLNNQPILVRAA